MNTQIKTKLTKSDLTHFHGDLARTRHPLVKKVLATPGTMFLFEKANAFWLWDAIASYQPEILSNTEKYSEDLRFMQFWTLKIEGTTAKLVCREDSGKPYVIEQDFGWTDIGEHCDFTEIDIWACYDETHVTLMLPSEY